MKKALVLIVLGIAIGTQGVLADLQHWDPGDQCFGNGDWDTSTANWTAACGPGDNTTWVNGNDASFGTGTSVITVGSAVTVGSISALGSGNLTFSGTGVYTFGTNSTVDCTRIVFFTAPYSGASTAVITKTGTGTIALNNSGNTFAGKWLVTGGRLSLSNERMFGTIPASAVTNAITLSAGVLRTTSGTAVTLNANRGIFLAGAGTWEVSAPNCTISLNSKISGPGALSLNLSGTPAGVTFGLNNTANDWTGAMTIGAGATCRLGASEVIPHSANVNCTVNGTLNFNGFNETIRAIAGSGTNLLGANNLTLNRSSGSATFSGLLSGSGNITKSAASTQIITGDNTAFTGRWILNSGKLSVPKDSSLGAVPGSAVTNKIQFGGGTLLTSAGFALNPNRGIFLSGNGTWEQADAAVEASYDGIITGNGAFTKSGAGTLVLNGDNTYTNTTTVSGGTLKFGIPTAVKSQTIAVNGAATVLDLNTATLALTGLSGSGTVMNSGGTPASISITNGRVAAGASLTGNAIGLLALQSHLNLTDSTNRWELGIMTDDNDGGVVGTDFDQISLTQGELKLSGANVLSIGFMSNSVAPDFATTFWQTAHKWTVVKMNGGSNPSMIGFTSVQTNIFYHAGSFSTAVETDGSLSLSFTPAEPTAPIILGPPTNKVVVTSSNTTFAVVATGTAPLSYQWFFNGSSIGDATDSTLAITDAQAVNEGTYRVEIMNSVSTTTSSDATLTLAVAPSIVTPPASQTVEVGSDAVFSVEATGIPAPTYQWKFNGTNISGATGSSYTRVTVQTNHAGSYSVLVTNMAGGQIVGDAILTVNDAQPPQPPVLSLSILNNIVTLSWASESGQTYRPQFKPNLNNPSWTDIPPDITGSGATNSITDAFDGTTNRFYRVITVP